MIIWGKGGDLINLGLIEVRGCPVCKGEFPFYLMLSYQYNHLYWIFGYVSKKEYMAVCANCKNGVVLDAPEVESHLAKVPIPFMRRYGCLVLIILFIILVLLSLDPRW